MIYAISPIIQGKEIDIYCFECGKIILAGIDLGEYGPFCVCKQDDCPYEDKRTQVIGDIEGEDVCVRKLVAGREDME